VERRVGWRDEPDLSDQLLGGSICDEYERRVLAHDRDERPTIDRDRLELAVVWGERPPRDGRQIDRLPGGDALIGNVGTRRDVGVLIADHQHVSASVDEFDRQIRRFGDGEIDPCRTDQATRLLAAHGSLVLSSNAPDR
jgi:hypothetical protein